MSGFEIAGVVLGAIPIVIEALSAYRAGKGVFATMLKWRGLVDKLIRQLEDQRRDFYFDILGLLREARVSEIIMEGEPTLDRCVEILQAAKTGDEVKQYLGPQHFNDFLEILGLYETYLKEITSKLGTIVRPQNASQPAEAAIYRSTYSSLTRSSRLPKTISRPWFELAGLPTPR